MWSGAFCILCLAIRLIVTADNDQSDELSYLNVTCENKFLVCKETFWGQNQTEVFWKIHFLELSKSAVAYFLPLFYTAYVKWSKQYKRLQIKKTATRRLWTSIILFMAPCIMLTTIYLFLLNFIRSSNSYMSNLMGKGYPSRASIRSDRSELKRRISDDSICTYNNEGIIFFYSLN